MPRSLFPSVLQRLIRRRASWREDLQPGPIRGELLGADHLADRARTLAREQQVAAADRPPRSSPLLGRLGESRRILLDARDRLATAASQETDIGPAGEWLLDNFWVIEEHIREVRESLPIGYYRELPVLSAGPLRHYPRIYELAITLISHTEGRIEVDNLDLFTRGFQEVAPLKIGELWAVAACLRMGLIENVRRMALRTVQRLIEMESAELHATRLRQASAEGEEALSRAVEQFLADAPGLTTVFVATLRSRLRESGFTSAPPLIWLNRWLNEEGLGAEEAAGHADQRVALTQVIMANSIGSLRMVGRMDWQGYVERHSEIEAILRRDPANCYGAMTFLTRDWYRHVVERIARRSGRSEAVVAYRVIELAERAGPGYERARHVGHYLIGDGLPELESDFKYRTRLSEWIVRQVRRHPNLVFIGGLMAGTVLALAIGLVIAGPGAWWLALPFLLLPALDIAVHAINQLVTAFLPPRVLPKLDLRTAAGIPESLRSLVALPILVESPDAVQAALENLETQFLANRGERLHFALLTDFIDASSEHTPDDAAILSAAVAGIQELNARYAPDAADAFYLFHRSREWNAVQSSWMGWERKRGKLADLNRFLLHETLGRFSTTEGNLEALRGVRYVITLDADTVLPPDGAALLIGAIAHPLNRAIYDPARGRVTEGYGILQPRVGVSLPSAYKSRFAEIHSGHPGVDPYTTAVSDVYQDLYGEGSFTGKGIYEVAIFEEATRGRFPVNTLLSHDLIEGNYARAGLVTDITVYDDYPARYRSFTRRKHRWIRGDWQLLRWLGPSVPGPDGPEPNRLSLLSRWKVIDNLRRSTVEISQLLLLLAGWTILPGDPVRWTGLGLGAIAAPWVIAMLLAILRPPRDKSWRAYYVTVGHDTVTSARQAGLALITLPHQALVAVDAIGRTLWRLLVTHRRLLEWQTASQVEQASTGSIGGIIRSMASGWLAPIGLIIIALVHLVGAGTISGRWVMSAAPLVSLWLSAPFVVYLLDGPVLAEVRRLGTTARKTALRYALLHWRYFDRFVNAESGWLVPDNYQEPPARQLALRTSPTNIGLQLLATVSAVDLGFLLPDEAVNRLERAFASLQQMTRYRGHFLNWYALPDLRVLEPAYVSTVDSGNLAGHLIALRQGCFETADAVPRIIPRLPVLLVALELASQRLVGFQSTDLPASAVALLREEGGVLRQQAQLMSSGESSARQALESLESVLAHVRTLVDSHLAETAQQVDLREWIDWSLQCLESHRAWKSRLAPEGQAAASASLRELAQSNATAADLVQRLDRLAELAYQMAQEMEFGFLFDPQRKLLAIGYHVGSHTRDNSFYDLLASEARLASYLAIGLGAVPAEHWFRLGRTLTGSAGETLLVSWSGSMFEYLMPGLVMRSFPLTVLDQTYRHVVRRQIAYGTERHVPWGVSESAYNLLDRHDTYQYRAFGVPDIALKRGLSRDLVVAPYASALALMVDPPAALRNLALFEELGGLGPYGFRDAFDYTRPDPGSRVAIVRNYMAHHVGMSLVALTNLLSEDIWPRRFHADALVRSTELLLHERLPRRLTIQKATVALAEEARPDPDLERPAVREYDLSDTAVPHIALLGRLPCTTMISSAGGGYTRYGDLATTRWRADGTRDNTGLFIYLKDLETGRAWSAAHQPLCAPAEFSRARLATDRVTFERRDGAIETRTEVVIVPADAAEVRRVTVTNNGTESCEIELTSYGEIVLAPPDAERAHPAFSNLFIETEWHPWCAAITATRRPRSPQDQSLWCVHVVDTSPDAVAPVSCETDRARFLGRGRTARSPVALQQDGALSGFTGAVLDPIFALRVRIRLRPGQSGSVAFTTLVAASREQAFDLADRYHDPHAADRALDLAWTATQVELRELNLAPTDAAVFQELAGSLFYGGSPLGPSAADRERNHGGQPLLWQQGISGDWPILIATIDSIEGLPTLTHLFIAHHYWRRRGMTVDLVVLNQRASSYLQDLQDRIMDLWLHSNDAGNGERPGGVFIRRTDALSVEELRMLRATARVQIACDGRALGHIIESGLVDEDAIEEPVDLSLRLPRMLERAAAGVWRRGSAAIVPRPLADAAVRPATLAPPRPLQSGTEPLLLDNGTGGLRNDGAYVIRVAGDTLPPAPWVNVIANPHGGLVISERGAGYSWAANAYFYRLTPWHNDPVSDPPGDVLYLRDESTGELWSATPAPCRTPEPWEVIHGQGYSSFTQSRSEITSHLTVGLAPDAMVKLATLRLTNHSRTARVLSVTQYAEWALGVLREHTQHQVVTTFDRERGAIFARNNFNPLFADWVGFAALDQPVTAYSGSRRDFLGHNSSLSKPRALMTDGPWGGIGGGNDPCAALQCQVRIEAGATVAIGVLLGAAPDLGQAQALVDRYRRPDSVTRGIDSTKQEWQTRLSTIQVHTPDPAFDAMLNQWSLYQALSCRMWARSALYQSGGAYGFRDQLQDVLAFVYAEPLIAREHILRSAAHQFIEGDVLHWWHPQSGRGVRTRFSDDLAWLPYVVEQYQRVTGDEQILDEVIPFLTMRTLEPHEHEVYDLPQTSEEHGSLYEHCRRALVRAATTGPHGLPLIGSGDWNDGMNRVGIEGQGESIWLAWFLITTLRSFADIADRRGDTATASDFRTQADQYGAAVEQHGWDGEWYRRGYFDNGTPLGSASNPECRIDSIAQSWSVISRAGNPDRQTTAMASLHRYLVNEAARLLPLLQPPFDKSNQDPGYIRGYLPGVRENGAQYTHAALWAVLATARRGQGDEAFRLFQMINPLTHARTPDEVKTYKVEPYVVAADVYTAPGQLGRGGWTWYTGSASWLYRVGLESILGFELEGDRLRIAPCVPADWAGYQIDYRHRSARYQIRVERAERAGIVVDGHPVEGDFILLADDGATHQVVVYRP